MDTSHEHRVGGLTITKIHELDLPDFTAAQLLPDIPSELLENPPVWIDESAYQAATGKVALSVHSWLIRGGGRTVLVDTGAGNGKARPKLEVLDHLHTSYLDRLAAAGVRPGEIDYVLLTHLHADHVGWNTSFCDGTWTPTFPNATVICSALEWRYGVALAAGDEASAQAIRAQAGLGDAIRTPTPGVFQDSVAPIEEAGLLQTITVDGHEIWPGLRFLPAPGHSIDHAVIEVESEGRRAIFGGDLVHHPFELRAPALVSSFCEFPDRARSSRRELFERIADTDTLYFSSHFPGSSAGWVTRQENGYRWHPAEEELSDK